MFTIEFRFEQKGIDPIVLREVRGGETLLEIALQNDIDLHHNCGGVCACTTCHLYIIDGGEWIDEMGRREEDFIRRARNPRNGSRLGCQSLLLDRSGEIIIEVPDQSVLPDAWYE